ncbi:MFS transporter [Kocuria tytonicola]|uniref:MFS transporter n=1 Tax=Kocuria tytonicola TaxID=2055946 RepID=A0A3L9LA79_9MICC|nr:MFS transporter [Kocuria tytonicola]RLY94007.1 MFS transporter [Kocuria tytonicola]
MARFLLDISPVREIPDFRRLWMGSTLSMLGSQFTVIAISLEVFELTRSTFAVGMVGVFALVPLIVAGLYGGSIGDASDRRLAGLWTTVGLFAMTVALAAHAWLDVRSVGVLYGIVALHSFAQGLGQPVRGAIVPRLVPARQLPAANALFQLTMGSCLMVGPLLGAFTVAGLGFAWAYTLDALSFAVSLWAMYKLPPLPPEPGEGGATRAGFRSVVEGFRFLATRPNLRMTFLLDIAAMVFAMPRVLFPVLGASVLGGDQLTVGLLTASLAAGSVISGVFSGTFIRINHHGRACAAAVAGWAVCIMVFGAVVLLASRGLGADTAWPLVLSCATLVAAGVMDSVSMLFRTTILQAATPDSLRSRLQGIFIVVVAGGPRLGDAVLGAGGQLLGPGWAALAGAAVCLVLVLVLVRAFPGFLRYDARDPQP